MSTSPNGADIIIKGGSVEIEFNEQTFSGKGGKYSNKTNQSRALRSQTRTATRRRPVTLPANGNAR